MPSDKYKQPKRTKKAYKKRALVFSRQYDYSRRRSALYQSQVFYTFGAELGLINSLHALSLTVDKFNETYQDTLDPQHGLLILIIKHYVTLCKVDAFHPEDIRKFYNLRGIYGAFAHKERKFKRLLNDLMHYDFLNDKGHKLMPTTRVRVFVSMYQKILKELFETSAQ